jgi:fructose-1,6-bisphosphatase I
MDQLITIERHILNQEREHPEATGAFSALLYDIALAAKIIARETMRAGLTQILGMAGRVNVQGEQQMKLDAFAHETIARMAAETGRLAAMASEEADGLVPIPEPHASRGRYALLVDPLDGSSNIDVNVSVGTIFALCRRKSQDGPGVLEDCLQPGRDLAAAGYVIYGPSNMLVYTTGHGVHGFTLDPSLGEFLLSHPDLRFPGRPKYYSANQGNEHFWSAAVRRYTDWLQGVDPDEPSEPLAARYVGSLVADFHRNVLAGGIYYYPADARSPRGKLRLAYEAAPLAFIAEQAGGAASDGTRPILDIQPASLHQRTPLYIGNRALVEKAEECLRRSEARAAPARPAG